MGLTPGSVVDQPLTASHDDLSVVSVPFATSIGTSAARVRVTLADASGQVLVDRTLDAKDLTDLGYKDISFAPIPHSAGMTFHVGLKTPSAITGQPLSVVTAPATTGTPPLTMNGQVGTVALPVHTFYGSLLPAWRALPVLMERVSQYKPGILKLPWLAIWLVAALAATGAWAWTGNAAVPSGGRAPGVSVPAGNS